MAKLADIAYAIKDAIAGMTFDPVVELAPQRVWSPTALKTHADGAIQCYIVPVTDENAIETRKVRKHDYSVNIGIQKKVAVEDETEECDALVHIAEQIVDALALLPMANCAWQGGSIAVAVSPENLKNHSVCTTVITCRYVGRRGGA